MNKQAGCETVRTSGVILAGGKSSRMKFNKAFAIIEGKRVIDIIVNKFERIFSETLIICNEPELFSDFGPRVFTDVIPRQGPLSGIHAGLYYAKNESVFVCGCDMPFVSEEIIAYLISKLGGHDSAVPEIDGHLQPTSAAYNRKCIPIIQEHIEQGKLKLTRVFREQLNAVIVDETELARFENFRDAFFNINDLDALERARESAGRFFL